MAEQDYTHKYNTPLSHTEQQQFEDYVDKQSKLTGRNVGNDLYDYDLQGWWLRNGGPNAPDLSGGHLTDQFKKPNHPTFSDQSMYNGVDGTQAGQWVLNPNNTYKFIPGATNLSNYSPQELADYFQHVEPTNELILPESPEPE